jgi:hypothetical protein
MRSHRRRPPGEGTHTGHRGLVRYLVAAALALALLGASVAWDAASRSDLSAATSSLAHARSDLHRQTRHLHGTRDAGRGAPRQLQSASSSVATQALDLATLHQCLQGVSGGYQQLAAGNLPGTVGALDASSAACLAVEGGGTGGLVYPFDFPDPFVLTVGSTSYAYATDSVAGNIQVIRSTDLVHWSPVGDALPHLPSWAAPGRVWAPSVLAVGGGYVMYYAVSVGSSGVQCISSATSASPTGPFVDTSSAPLVCQASLGGSIDPSAFVDPTAGIFLDWKSEGTAGQPPTLWAQQLTGTGTTLAGSGPTALLTPTEPWEHGVVEAPDMVWLDGQRYLFFSGARWTTATYATGVATCTGPLGPCTVPSSAPVLASGAGLAGPGGASAFTDPAGTPYLAFAAWLPGQVGEPHSRVLYVRPLQLAGGVPTVGPGGP